jgi:virulence-associated protein VagC
MKNRFDLAVFLVIMALFGFSSAMAQEDRLPDLDSGTKEASSIEIYPEGDNKIIRPVTVNRDSLQVKPAINRKTEGKGKDENPSVLSFNFLYYLIERYKLSDIVD